MSRGVTVHGFRSNFRDWAAERTNYPNHVVEMALAHAVGDKVEAAYRRGDLFEKRRRLMEDWAQYCGRPGWYRNVLALLERERVQRWKANRLLLPLSLLPSTLLRDRCRMNEQGRDEVLEIIGPAARDRASCIHFVPRRASGDDSGRSGARRRGSDRRLAERVGQTCCGLKTRRDDHPITANAVRKRRGFEPISD